MNNLICPFCLQDIGNGNHAWNCEMNPINMNNNEFQLNTYKYPNNLSSFPLNLEEIIKNSKIIKIDIPQSVDL